MRINNWITCRIVERMNRFVVKINISGEERLAYINNTGRLLEYMVPGRKAYCIPRKNPGKTTHRLFAIEDLDGAALIDTGFQMDSFEKLVVKKEIPWLKDCRLEKRNPRLEGSVLDFLLNCSQRPLYVETKSAVLRGDSIYAMYPDCPTLRGRRHIRELTRHAEKGGLGAIIFIAALPRVNAFKPYPEGDPEIPRLLRIAAGKGVLVKAINIYFNPKTSMIVLVNPDLPVILDVEG